MMSVNGVMAGNTGGFSISDTYSRQNCEARVNRWINYPDKLEAVTNRLRGIRIEKKDGIDLLAAFSNKPATLVYIDPPYLAKRTLGYKIEAADVDFHERLLSQALLCKCMIVISSYESETYTKLLRDRGAGVVCSCARLPRQRMGKASQGARYCGSTNLQIRRYRQSGWGLG